MMNNGNRGYIDMWDKWTKGRVGVPAYDNWLDDYKDILEENKENEILDLGCGVGADTLYLLERGFKVLSCDFSNEALKSVQENIPGSKIKYLNMLDKFPFEDETFSIIVADLSLHYFDDETTIHIMNEIKRVLKNNGVLLARVATVKDFNFGAGVGEELEKNYYFEGDYAKRFFEQVDVDKYFGIIGNVESSEKNMIRDEKEYLKPKKLYQIKVTKGEINMNKEFIEKWLGKLKEYWFNKDIESAVSLFTSTAYYQETPFMEPYTTIEEIRQEWQHVKDEDIHEIEFKVLAIDGYTVIVEWLLSQNDEKYDGIYEIKFNEKLECIYFKSWEMMV